MRVDLITRMGRVWEVRILARGEYEETWERRTQGSKLNTTD